MSWNEILFDKLEVQESGQGWLLCVKIDLFFRLSLHSLLSQRRNKRIPEYLDREDYLRLC